MAKAMIDTMPLDLEAMLAQRFQPSAAGDLDVVVALATDAGERLTTFTVRHGVLRFDHGAVPDVTLFFRGTNPSELPASEGVFHGRSAGLGQEAAQAPALGRFDGAQTALGIFAGSTDPMAAFMAGAFRADGNLPLVFVLLGLFRGDFHATPRE